MVSLFAFVMTAYGLNPYLIATFSSGLACENAKSQILAAAREQALPGTTTYALAPRSLKCIATPGLVAGGARLPESVTAPSTKPKPAAPSGKAGTRSAGPSRKD